MGSIPTPSADLKAMRQVSRCVACLGVALTFLSCGSYRFDAYVGQPEGIETHGYRLYPSVMRQRSLEDTSTFLPALYIKREPLFDSLTMLWPPLDSITITAGDIHWKCGAVCFSPMGDGGAVALFDHIVDEISADE